MMMQIVDGKIKGDGNDSDEEEEDTEEERQRMQTHMLVGQPVPKALVVINNNNDLPRSWVINVTSVALTRAKK